MPTWTVYCCDEPCYTSHIQQEAIDYLEWIRDDKDIPANRGACISQTVEKTKRFGMSMKRARLSKPT